MRDVTQCVVKNIAPVQTRDAREIRDDLRHAPGRLALTKRNILCFVGCIQMVS